MAGVKPEGKPQDLLAVVVGGSWITEGEFSPRIFPVFEHPTEAVAYITTVMRELQQANGFSDHQFSKYFTWYKSLRNGLSNTRVDLKTDNGLTVHFWVGDPKTSYTRWPGYPRPKWVTGQRFAHMDFTTFGPQASILGYCQQNGYEPVFSTYQKYIAWLGEWCEGKSQKDMDVLLDEAQDHMNTEHHVVGYSWRFNERRTAWGLFPEIKPEV